MTEPSAGLEQEETEHDVELIHECVVKMAKEISDFMDITPDKQRMDSLMVAANIRNLSLLELFYTCVANLCKIMDERGTKIPDEQYHYIKKDDYNKCIYHKRDMDATERTIAAMKDADVLIYNSTIEGVVDTREQLVKKCAKTILPEWERESAIPNLPFRLMMCSIILTGSETVV